MPGATETPCPAWVGVKQSRCADSLRHHEGLPEPSGLPETELREEMLRTRPEKRGGVPFSRFQGVGLDGLGAPPFHHFEGGAEGLSCDAHFPVLFVDEEASDSPKGILPRVLVPSFPLDAR